MFYELLGSYWIQTFAEKAFGVRLIILDFMLLYAISKCFKPSTEFNSHQDAVQLRTPFATNWTCSFAVFVCLADILVRQRTFWVFLNQLELNWMSNVKTTDINWCYKEDEFSLIILNVSRLSKNYKSWTGTISNCFTLQPNCPPMSSWR